jgi:hypothetical protein
MYNVRQYDDGDLTTTGRIQKKNGKPGKPSAPPPLSHTAIAMRLGAIVDDRKSFICLLQETGSQSRYKVDEKKKD